MTREELLKSKEYWITKIQLDLFELINDYMTKNKINRTQLAKKLGVSKGYITQVLNGNFDHKISKLVELATAFGKVPLLEYKDFRQYVHEDRIGINKEAKYIDIIAINISAEAINKKNTTKTYLKTGSISAMGIRRSFNYNTMKGLIMESSLKNPRPFEFCHN